MKKILTAMTLMLAAALQGRAQIQDGPWHGVLQAGGTELNIVLRLATDSAGQRTCSFDSPDQMAFGIPATVRTITDDSLCVNVPRLVVTYSARLRGDTLQGTFVQMMQPLKLNLTPGEVTYNRPQDPRPPFPYTAEEVVFLNPEDSAMLAGTLVHPQGDDTGMAVVFVTGSGPENRDEEIFGHKPFLVIADYLARQGIASLRFDDRGVGGSTNGRTPPRDVTTLTLAGDARAAVDYLRQSGRYRQIGIIGHSEGGLIAFILASEGEADFIVSMAGPGLSGLDVSVLQNLESLRKLNIDQATLDRWKPALREILRQKLDGQTPDVAALMGEGYDRLPTSVRDAFAAPDMFDAPWVQTFMRMQPADYISRIECPVLAINGTLDKQVDADANLTAIRAALPANERNKVKTYEGLNHLFQPCQTGDIGEYARIELTISPEVLEEMAVWMRQFAF